MHRFLSVAGWIVVSVSALAVAKTAIQANAVSQTPPAQSVLAVTVAGSTPTPLLDQSTLSSKTKTEDVLPLTDLQSASINHLERGALLFHAAGSTAYRQAPEVATDVDMDITGMLAQVSVKQQFTNPTSEWLNGIYVFPLPENAAVFGLKMHIGERVIEGQIKEREQAQRTYKKARDAGRKASLVEQERPNIFTTSLANIAPGESITIELQYQQTLTYDQNKFNIRFPMVVATRYIPGNKPIRGFSGSGWAINTQQVPDAQRISPPVTHPKGTSGANPVSITVRLDAGFPLASLDSAYHAIRQTRLGGERYLIQLTEHITPANRDFELSWTPERGDAPQGALFTQKHENNETYGLLMVMPQRENIDQNAILPRELVYVIDTSGSMEGESIIQAKQALHYSLGHLRTQDTFRVIEFNSRPSAMSENALASTPANINRAKHFVDNLSANGGTEVASALAMAFSEYGHDSEAPGTVLRQIVLLTDGSVGNETELFRLIKGSLGESRLFTIGIGSSPNSYFMREAATLGRGSFTYIGNTSEVRSKLVVLFKKMAKPVLSNITIHWPGAAVSAAEIWPNPVPDVYLGEPLIVSIKLPPKQQDITINGIQAGSDWSVTLPVHSSGQAKGLDRLWASHKLRSLTSQQRLSSTPKEYQGEITRLALKHHLLSKYTSLVAVDVSPITKPVHKSANSSVKSLNPYGNTGVIPQTATPAQLKLLVGLLLLLLYFALRHKRRRTLAAV